MTELVPRKTVNASGCPFCGGRVSEPVGTMMFDETHGVKPNAVWHRCGGCGGLFNSRVMLDREARKYYDGNYRPANYPTLHDRAKQLARAERQMILMSGIFKFPPPTCVLDYGCANGVLLEELSKEFGCEVWGTEYSSLDRAVAKERAGLDLVEDLDGLPDLKEYDLIVLSHVLEHMPDPIGILRSLRSFAMLDARLFIEVPSPFTSSAWQLFHTSCFTPDTLKAVIQASGWAMLGGSRSEGNELFWAAAINGEIPESIEGPQPVSG